MWKIFSTFSSRLVKFHLMRKVYLWSWVNFLKNLLCVSSTLWTWNPCQYIIISEIWIYTLTNLKNVVSFFFVCTCYVLNNESKQTADIREKRNVYEKKPWMSSLIIIQKELKFPMESSWRVKGTLLKDSFFTPNNHN